MKLAPGTMVSDSVRLLEPLGQGGMGAVWVGEHLGLKQKVAVKLILTEASHDPEFRQRFKREASIGARLNSPHCVQMLDYGVAADRTPYIVMELLQGTDLTHAVEIRGRMALGRVVGLIRQLAAVLERAHELGIVHRDIKPDNIFLVGENESIVKVLDFGVAKQKATGGDEVTETGAVVGSPEFMSPEQALSSKHVDHRSDLFSLAVVAYCALTGELPYEIDTTAQLWLRLATGERTPPSRYVPDLPAAVDSWFERALASRPESRFQSAKEMADALLAIAPEAAEPLEPPPESCDSQALTRRMLSPLELEEAQRLFRPGPTPAAGRTAEAPPANAPAAAGGELAEDGLPLLSPPSVREEATTRWQRPAAPAMPAPRSRTAIMLVVALVVAVLAIAIALALLR